MNLDLYRIFLVVAEEGNITHAGEKLHLSQPAVTKHIHSLEEYLGNPLFIRTKKGVVLNEAGASMFLKVKQAFTLLEEAEKEVGAYQEFLKGTIKIGISTTLTKRYLLPYLERFHKEYPNIIIDIYTDPTKELILKLKNGMIDFVIGKFPKSKDFDLNYQKLGTTKYIFACNPLYFNLSSLKAHELSNYPLLIQESPSNSRESIKTYLKDNEVVVEPNMNIASSNLLIDFTILGYGIGYVTKLYVEQELKENKLKEIKLVPDTEHISYGIISLKNNVMTTHAKKFIQFLSEK